MTFEVLFGRIDRIQPVMLENTLKFFAGPEVITKEGADGSD
jgi:hypothetical protein